jgi:hypothetical protein
MKVEILPSKSRWVAVDPGKSVSVTFECKEQRQGHPAGTKTGNVIHIFQSRVETIIAHDRPVLGAGSIGRCAALPLLWLHRARPARLGSKGAKPSGSRNDR